MSVDEGLRLFSQQRRKRYLKSQHYRGKTWQQTQMFQFLNLIINQTEVNTFNRELHIAAPSLQNFSVSWWSDISFFLFGANTKPKPLSRVKTKKKAAY